MGISHSLLYGYFQGMKWYRDEGMSAGIDRSARNRSTVDLPMKSVKEICQVTGVTRKTLFYYDRIGLLKPTLRIGPQEHKYYDDNAVETLQKIRLCKECGLQLSEIRMILQEDGSDVLAAGIRRLQQTGSEIEARIFLARLLQITGTSSHIVRLLSAFSIHEIQRIGRQILDETCLAPAMMSVKQAYEDDPAIIQNGFAGRDDALKLALILSADSQSEERILPLAEKEEKIVRQEMADFCRQYEPDASRQAEIMPFMQEIIMRKKEACDSTAVQQTAAKLAMCLQRHDPDHFSDRLTAFILRAEKDNADPFAVMAVVIFYLKYVFAKREDRNE